MEMCTVARAREATLSDRWIEADPSVFRENFDRNSFEVAHHLASHPLFELPRLMELAERTLKTRPSDLYYDMGEIAPGQKWKDTNRAFSAGEGIESRISREDIIVFVASPRRVTAYHIDRECNFILQIHGDKDLHVFDREDREILPEEEIERFWTIDNNAPNYRPELQDRARSYRLVPGTGVHVPVNCPHWLRNGDDVSVTLSVNFQFVDSMRANIYRANHFLRKLGIEPSPPGRSAVRDRAKSVAYSIANAARRAGR